MGFWWYKTIVSYNLIYVNMSYYKSFTAAATAARNHATEKNYTVCESDWFNKIAVGGNLYVNEHRRASITLFTEKGNQARKYLNVIITRLSENTWELVEYIN